MADSKKKSRKERQRELRMLEKDISGGKSVIDYGKVNEVGVRKTYHAWGTAALFSPASVLV